jgi:hypothetical protein
MAGRWDGACLYKHQTHYLLPGDIRALRDTIRGQRGTLDGYDIAVGGSPRRADWEEERDTIRSLAEAGATWWTGYIPRVQVILTPCVLSSSAVHSVSIDLEPVGGL